jgi:hypothetical protein
MLSAQDQARLSSEFQSFERADPGAGAHQRFLDLAAGLCARLGLRRETRTETSSHPCCGHGTSCT